MRSVVDRCEDAGLLAASYFFSTRVPGLSHEHPFMATIAHQLSIDPILGPVILEAVRRRTTIFDESLDLQMKKLAIDPLKSHPRKVLIAIDGFDECSLQLERRHLFGLLYTLLENIPQSLVIVIASRPELDIRTTFDRRQFKVVTYVVQLQDYNGMEDTRIFICDEFDKIRETHPMRRHIPVGWPLEHVVGILLDKSSGHFIFPSTAMKYISNPRRNPLESLAEILALSSKTSTELPSGIANHNKSKPLAELDSLYDLILHHPEIDLGLVKRLLHCLIGLAAATELRNSQSALFIEGLLGLPPSTIEVALCDLHSLLSIPEVSQAPIRFHHKSLEDYLSSPDRSMDMFQESYETQLDLALCCIRRLEAWAKNPDTHGMGTIMHAARRWDDHLELWLLDRPDSHPIPNAILEFDPRIAWRAIFVYIPSLFGFTAIQNALHSNVCARSAHCMQLCKVLCWVERCNSKVSDFFSSFGNYTRDQKIKGPGQFDVDTGLYDPEAQSSNLSSSPRSATFPGLGAWPTFPSSQKALNT